MIPVLREQKIIRSTYLHFSRLIAEHPNRHIVFITTERENGGLASGEQTTRELLHQLLGEGEDTRTQVMHYPGTEGVMAHQLNFAVRNLLATVEQNAPFWIAVFNADSRVEEDSINWVERQICGDEGREVCYQQYAWFPNPVVRKRSILGSAALWQSRWSITFELGRLLVSNATVAVASRCRSTLGSRILEVLVEKMNYVIGHGLYVSSTTLSAVGGFPEVTINEDAFLGLKLNLRRVLIRPVPYLERADFAPSLAIYLQQQAVWFNGPLDAWRYRTLLLADGVVSDGPINRARLDSLTLKLFLHAIYWVISPLLLLVAPLLLIRSIQDAALWFLVVMMHLPITHASTRRCLVALGIPGMELPNASLLHCPLFFLLHCVGPLRCLAKRLVGSNTIGSKYKTER